MLCGVGDLFVHNEYVQGISILEALQYNHSLHFVAVISKTVIRGEDFKCT